MTTGSFSFLPRLTRPCWRGPLLGILTTLIGSGLPAGRPLEAQSPAPQVLPSIQVPGIPNAPDLVTVVPFYTKPDETKNEQTRVVIPAEVDGHRGLFILDMGMPKLELNYQFLQPIDTTHPGRHGIDTVTPSHPYPSKFTGYEVPVRVALRIGTLADTLSYYWQQDWVAKPEPKRNAFITNLTLGEDFAPHLGTIGFPALESFETIIDYTHMRVVLIRLDKAGHRLVDVPAYTPAWSAPLIEVRGRGWEHNPDIATWWGVQALLGGVQDTVFFDTGSQINGVEGDNTERFGQHITRAGEHDGTLDALVIAGRSFGSTPLHFEFSPPRSVLGDPFLSRCGVVGFNHRTHQFILYH